MRDQARSILAISFLFNCTPEGQGVGASATLEPGSSESGESGETDPTPTSSGAEPGSTGGSSYTTEPGSTGSSTTDTMPFCGDGEVDLDEQCDEGVEVNASTAFCTEECKFNICGDGNLFVGWELCDLGIANSDL